MRRGRTSGRLREQASRRGLTFGTGTPPRVPTDPDNADIAGFGDGGLITGYGSYLLDGFPLTILKGKPSLPRLQFEANSSRFWKPWCELQTPYLREGSIEDWNCVLMDAQGTWGYSQATGCVLGSPTSGGVSVNCAKVALCAGGGDGPKACTCTAAGCTVWGGGGNLQFDLRVVGDEISGNRLSGAMYLTRVR